MTDKTLKHDNNIKQMQKVDQMRSNIRNKMRREELDQRIRKIREKEIQRQKEDIQFQQNGTYGQALISDILVRAQYGSQVKQLREKYTLYTLSKFLDEPYDNSQNNIQAAVTKIIQSYFYQGLQGQPSEELTDKLLRLLTKSNHPFILKNILLIFNSSLLDYFSFANVLISKNFVPILLSFMENFVNNEELTRISFILIGSLVRRADQKADLIELIEPLLRAIKITTTIDAEKSVESIFYITKLKNQQIGPEIYKKGILGFCLDIIKRFRSRPASYLYFQFCSIFKGYLSLPDVGELMNAISEFREVHFQVGEMSGKYSISSIKKGAYELVLYFLNSQDVSEKTQKFMEESGLRTKLMDDLRDVDDHSLVKVLGDINLYFYKRSEGEQRLQYKSAFQSAISNWTDKDPCFELQTNYQTVTKFHLLSSNQEDMQIEP